MIVSLLKKIDITTLKYSFRASLPIILGYITTSLIFGFMLVSAGYAFWIAPLMSIVIYAGAGQYLAVTLFVGNSTLLNIALLCFLINSKHLFYGLSLLEPYKKYKILKPYMIFALTDETYAILTSPIPEEVNKKLYMFLVSFFNHIAWVFGSLLGALFGNLINIPTDGMDFAMTALFIVIIIEQLKHYKTKLPFIIGSMSGLGVCILIGKDQMLLLGSVFALILLLLFRKKIESDDNRN